MPIVVERKLFATGDSLAITLPKDWIKNFHLKAGDAVEIVLEDELTIKAKKEKGLYTIQT